MAEEPCDACKDLAIRLRAVEVRFEEYRTWQQAINQRLELANNELRLQLHQERGTFLTRVLYDVHDERDRTEHADLVEKLGNVERAQANLYGRFWSLAVLPALLALGFSVLRWLKP